MAPGISFRRFDDQSRIGARQLRHIEFELGMSEVAGLRGELCCFRGAIHARNHGRATHSLVGFISNSNLQHGAFAGEPGLGVEQFERENSGR